MDLNPLVARGFAMMANEMPDTSPLVAMRAWYEHLSDLSDSLLWVAHSSSPNSPQLTTQAGFFPVLASKNLTFLVLITFWYNLRHIFASLIATLATLCKAPFLYAISFLMLSSNIMGLLLIPFHLSKSSSANLLPLFCK